MNFSARSGARCDEASCASSHALGALIATRLAAKADAKPRKAPADKPRFPSHLERVEVILEPEVPPEFEGKERVKIGQEESVRLDVVRARFRLIVTIRPKYAYKEPAAILQAPAPEHIVEAGLPTEALLAQVLRPVPEALVPSPVLPLALQLQWAWRRLVLPLVLPVLLVLLGAQLAVLREFLSELESEQPRHLLQLWMLPTPVLQNLQQQCPQLVQQSELICH